MAENRNYKNTRTNDYLPQPISESQYGKLPPQALELEETLLGTLMQYGALYDKVSDILTPECFYKTAHGIIYEAICQLSKQGSPVDMLTVADILQKNGKIEEVGGAYALAMLTENTARDTHIVKHASIIFQKYVARKIIKMSVEIQNMAYADDDCEDILTFADKEMKSFDLKAKNNVRHIRESIGEMRENVKNNSQDHVVSSGSLTGFTEFDKRSGGFQPTDLIVIAAESSQGKTSLALNIADFISKRGEPIAIYSREMSSMQLASRITAFNSGLSSNDILYNRFTDLMFRQLDVGIGKIENSEIYIDESSTGTIDNILSSIRMMVRNFKIKGVVVDYLQLLEDNEKGLTTEAKTAKFARSLKNIAKDLGIWVVALSQLSRSDNPLPSKSRLRNSGQIEEAADVIWFIYRPEEYGLKTFPEPFNAYNVEGAAMHDIAKGRNIGTFKFLSKFDKRVTLFENVRDISELRDTGYYPSSGIKEQTPF